MSRFVQKAVITPVNGSGKLWMLDEDLIYESDLLAAKGYDPLVTIPAGFIYDGNSIPGWLKAIPLVSYFVKDRTAFPGSAALHDYGYRFHTWPRKLTDQLYREALGVEGASRPRSTVRFWGVRLGGWWAYRKKEPADGERL